MRALAPVRRHSGWRTGVIAVMATGAVLLPGCTGQRAAEAPPTTPPATSPTAPLPATPEPSEPRPEPVQIQFVFRRPDPPCPPTPSMETLPLADRHPYELANSHSDSDTEVERFGYHLAVCGYQRADIGDGEDMILEDHGSLSAELLLWPRWEDSVHAGLGLYPALPVESADLDQWRVAAGFHRERAGWEGCGEETPCEEGEEPTVRTRKWLTDFHGHVGNLEFDVTVAYIAQRRPADLEQLTVEIFRDFVLAAMESYERAD